MAYKQFSIAIIGLCLILLIAVATMKLTILSAPASINTKEIPVIILDAGHGGFDGGAIASDGTLEKDINLAITLKLKEQLTPFGFDIVMVRETDTGTEDNSKTSIRNRKISDLKNRLKLMNKYPNTIYISIHLNKFEMESCKGAQTFYASNVDNAKILAIEIQTSITSMLQTENYREAKPGSKSTYLLHNAKTPAVIVECGFLSNSDDLQNLKNEEYQSKISFSIACGILKYLNEPKLGGN